jgi:hypothetical protein
MAMCSAHIDVRQGAPCTYGCAHYLWVIRRVGRPCPPSPPSDRSPFVSLLYPGVFRVRGIFCARSGVHTRVCLTLGKDPRAPQPASPCEPPDMCSPVACGFPPVFSRPRFVGGRAQRDRTGAAGRPRAASPSTAVVRQGAQRPPALLRKVAARGRAASPTKRGRIVRSEKDISV